MACSSVPSASGLGLLTPPSFILSFSLAFPPNFILYSYWPLSLLNQLQWHIFTEYKGIFLRAWEYSLGGEHLPNKGKALHLNLTNKQKSQLLTSWEIRWYYTPLIPALRRLANLLSSSSASSTQFHTNQGCLNYETLSQKKRQTGFNLVTRASNPSTWEVEAGRAGVQSHPQLLQDQFELYEIVSQNYK